MSKIANLSEIFPKTDKLDKMSKEDKSLFVTFYGDQFCGPHHVVEAYVKRFGRKPNLLTLARSFTDDDHLVMFLYYLDFFVEKQDFFAINNWRDIVRKNDTFPIVS